MSILSTLKNIKFYFSFWLWICIWEQTVIFRNLFKSFKLDYDWFVKNHVYNTIGRWFKSFHNISKYKLLSLAKDFQFQTNEFLLYMKAICYVIAFLKYGMWKLERLGEISEYKLNTCHSDELVSKLYQAFIDLSKNKDFDIHK